MSSAKPLLLVVDYGDGPQFELATVKDLASLCETMQYGHADVTLCGVYAVGVEKGRYSAGTGEPVAVEYRIDGAGFYNEDQWAKPTVTVAMPDGGTLTAGFKIDGRS